MIKPSRLWFILLCFAVLASCGKGEGKTTDTEKPPKQAEKPAGTEAPAAGKEAGSPETKKPDRSLSLSLDKPTEKTAAAKKPLKTGETGKREFLSVRTAAVFPEDMKIGPLLDIYSDENENDRELSGKITSFLGAYGADSGWVDYFSPEMRLPLERSLSGFNTNPSTAIGKYRIGVLRSKDETCSCNIRLFGATGRTEAELYLVKIESSWYINDMQADMWALSGVYEPGEPFEPNIYRWLSVP